MNRKIFRNTVICLEPAYVLKKVWEAGVGRQGVRCKPGPWTVIALILRR
jgi:hypothetical protein